MKKTDMERGIRFRPEVRIQENKRTGRQRPAGIAKYQTELLEFRWLILYVLMLSAVFGICIPLKVPVLGPVVFGGLFAETLALGAVLSSSKYKKLLTAGIWAAYLLLLLLLRRMAAAGIQEIADCVLLRYNSYFKRYVPLFQPEGAGGWEVSVALLFIMFPVAFLMAAGTVKQIKMRYILPVLLLNPGVPMVLGLMPDVWSGMALIPALLCAGTLQGLEKRKKSAGKKKRIMVSRPEKQVELLVQRRAGLWCGLAWVCIGVLLASVAAPRLQENFGEQKRSARFSIQDWMAGLDLNRLMAEAGPSWLPWSLTLTGGMSGGKTGRADTLVYTGEEHLLVHIKSSNSPMGPLYLKGYAGSVYTGSGWEELPRREAETLPEAYNGRLGLLCREAVEQGNVLAGALSASGKDPVQAYVTVTGGDSSYTYVPEGVLPEESGGLSPVQDLYWEGGNGVLEYYPTIPMSVVFGGSEETMAAQAEAVVKKSGKISMEDSEEYERRVMEIYTALPEKGLEQTREMMEGLTAGDFQSMQECISFVRRTLFQEAVYSLSPGRTPGGEDFVEYFLFTQKKGYCVHFASAGVVLFRMLGIPARFAEGYLTGTAGGTENISVKDSDAHAWVEIFCKGIGWIPVEMTPGYAGPQENETLPAVLESTAPSSEEESRGTETASRTLPHSLSTETSSGEISEAGAEGHGSNGKSPAGNAGKLLAAAGAAAGGILLLAGAVALRRKTTVDRRRKKMMQKDRRKAVLYSYGQMKKLTAWMGAPLTDKTEDGEAVQKYGYLKAGEYEDYLEMLQQVRFSSKEATAGQAQKSAALYEKICRQELRRMNGWERFLMKYWKCFC